MNRWLFVFVASFASLLHLSWALAYILDAQACGSTPCDALPGSRWQIIAALVLFSVLAEVAILGFVRHRARAFVLMLPQQALLVMSAIGSGRAVWLSQYAHNSPPGITRGFLWTDQSLMILVALVYSVSLIATYGARMRGIDAA